MSISKIEDGLWLGTIGARKNTDRLLDLGIEVVVSVLTADERDTLCKELPDNITEYDIDLEDSSRADLAKAIHKLTIIVEREKRKGVLVHCQMGMSRSPAVIIGYLMQRDNTSFGDTLEKVKTSHPSVMLNSGFVKQLEMKRH